MSIQTNIQEVRQRIAAACGECGRDPKEITLVGASKMNDAAAARPLTIPTAAAVSGSAAGKSVMTSIPTTPKIPPQTPTITGIHLLSRPDTLTIQPTR